MTRREKLRSICENTCTSFHFGPGTSLYPMLFTCAYELFLQGVSWRDDDEARAVYEALVEFEDTGTISEAEHGMF